MYMNIVPAWKLTRLDRWIQTLAEMFKKKMFIVVLLLLVMNTNRDRVEVRIGWFVVDEITPQFFCATGPYKLWRHGLFVLHPADDSQQARNSCRF